MANTISVMTNVLRNAVSKQRIRYKEKGFNLDLAYICDNIIAMGYPADNLESIYRNRLEDVYKFLEENHHNHYKIYNLCLERSYDVNKFHGRVAVYPFEDHNPPTIELIQKFCNDVDSWLKADSLNVAAVHCKAGKGRTGTMICCYLLYSGQQTTAEDALACYDEKRTKDRKGVTIPSQRRYVQYFSKLIQSGLPYEKRTLQFCEIRFIEANLLHSQGTVHCSISVLQDTACTVKVQQLRNLTIDFRKSVTLEIQNPSLSISGDIKVELTHKRQKIFHFWFNTYFVFDAAVIEGEGSESKLVYTLSKCEIDDAHKDKEHKSFSEDFKVQLVFFVDSSSVKTQNSEGNRISNHRTTQNTCLAQNNYVLPKNNSSGSDLNICDQKSTSSASISTLGGAGFENSNFHVKRSSSTANSNVQPVVVFAGGTNFPEKESTMRVGSASPLPMSPPPLIAQLNDCRQHFLTQSQDYVKTAFTATSTPNQKQLQKAEHVFSRSHRQQQYVPSACVPRVNSDNTNSFVQCSPQTPTKHTNSNSKSSSISSNSSSSNSGDNDEDWESGESSAKLLAHNTLLLSSVLSSSPATHSSYTPASILHTSSNLNPLINSSSSFKDTSGGDDDKIQNFNQMGRALAQYTTFDGLDCEALTIEATSNTMTGTNHTAHQVLLLPVAQPLAGSILKNRKDLALKTKPTTQKPFFRRKSFKSGTASAMGSTTLYGSDALTTPANSTGFNCSGLAATSKQKLKIKLRKNKIKLSQKFQWFQNYFRSDPVDFSNNFVQHTTEMRRNSGSSATGHQRKFSGSTPPSSLPTRVNDFPVNNTKPLGTTKPSSSDSTTMSNTSLSAGDLNEDYYSSICDNQLSFNNSPCKSPRSLGDIVRVGGSCGNRFTPSELKERSITPNIKSLGAGGAGKTVVVVGKPSKASIGFTVSNDLIEDPYTSPYSDTHYISPYIFETMETEFKRLGRSFVAEQIQGSRPERLLILKENTTKNCLEDDSDGESCYDNIPGTKLKLESAASSKQSDFPVVSTCSNSSSSGFGTSECCTNSSSSSNNCNPFFALDAELGMASKECTEPESSCLPARKSSSVHEKVPVVANQLQNNKPAFSDRFLP